MIQKLNQCIEIIKKRKKIKITKEEYDDMLKQIKDGEDGTMRENHEKYNIKKEFNNYKERIKEVIEFKDIKINKLESKVTKQESQIKNLLKTIDKKLKGQKGGYIKQINELQRIVSAYEQSESQSKEAFKALEDKNNLQALKIKELLSKQEHSIEEYKYDGLPQTTKKALSKKK